MIKKIQIIIILLSSQFVSSQDLIKINYSDSTLNRLIQKYQKLNHYKKILVYRIQVESSHNSEKIKDCKKKYEKKFPAEKVEEVFEPPFFKAITGVFYDKKKAEEKLLEVKKVFRNSFIYQEKITMEEFKENKLN